ncbi:MAG: hypothetical protein KF841_12085 [Phycisphaerae bacterium]|nr:hypothetical protein [Phycisphaerae bacterium]
MIPPERAIQQNDPPSDPLAVEPRWKMWGCLALLMVALLIVVAPRISLSRWEVIRHMNAAFDEAMQWRDGKLYLSDAAPIWEAPAVDGRKYNVVGHVFVLLSLVGVWLSELTGAPPGQFYPPYYILMLAAPVPLVAFGVFRLQTRSAAWGAVLAGYFIAGTCMRPVLWHCRGSSIYYINHVIAATGLLIFAADMLGRRRVWPAAIGLILAAWSRQMTCLYALPFLWLTWTACRSPRGNPPSAIGIESAFREITPAGRSVRTSYVKFFAALGVVAVIGLYPMAMSYAKLGNPLDSGYPGMYVGRTDKIALDAQSCFWGTRWFPRHFKSMNLTLPTPDIRENTIYFDNTDRDGGSIWFTTPLLLAVFATARRWWRDPARRALMLSSLLVIFGLWGYHTTGSHECGYYRYALDFIPIWFAVIAPYVTTPRAAPWTLACLAWSTFYFFMLLP